MTYDEGYEARLDVADIESIFRNHLTKLRKERQGTYVDPNWPRHLDWSALFAREAQHAWLVQDFWPTGRHLHLHATRKSGKSLVALWIACNLATGRDPFSWRPIPPVKVAYFDFEMTEDDLLERVEEMNFGPSDLENRLLYWLSPMIPPLDTAKGGALLADIINGHECKVCIIDTMSRVISGDENSNDTYIRFFEHTGRVLRHYDIAMLRLDHEGHETGRSRGASAKADDVDVIWQLQKMENDSIKLERKASRVAWVGEQIVLQMTDPLAFTRVEFAWPTGTVEKAKQLDEAGIPLDASQRNAVKMLKAHGFPGGRITVLLAALRYRRETYGFDKGAGQ